MNSCRKNILTAIGLLCLFSCSCSKPIDNTGEAEDKLVIYAQLQDHKPIRIHLGRSSAIQDSHTHLPILQPKLYSSNGDSIALFYESAGWYYADKLAQIGESYNIEVQYNSKSYTATTQLPQKPQLLYSKIEYTGQEAPDGSGPISLLEIGFIDDPNTSNYYVLDPNWGGDFEFMFYQMNEPIFYKKAIGNIILSPFSFPINYSMAIR